jgi:hypothetical protein
MEHHGYTDPAGGQMSDRELGFFTLEILLVVASIVLLVHFRSPLAVVFAVGSLLVVIVTAATCLPGASAKGQVACSTPRRRRQFYRCGDYGATSDALFRIEEFNAAGAVVENCRSGELIDLSFGQLETLRPVRIRQVEDRRGDGIVPVGGGFEAARQATDGP